MDERIFSLDKYFETIKGIAQEPNNVEPELLVEDQIDGKYVVSAYINYDVGNERIKTLDATSFKGVSIETTDGQGIIERDRYTQ